MKLPNQRMKLTGAAILVSRGMKVLQAAPAAYPYRSATGGARMGETFTERWSRKERDCGFSDIASKMVACGPNVLPDSAAPCVTFKEAARPVPIWEVFASPPDWSPADRERLAPYRMIGSDGAGNPICVEEGTGAVVLLDHEDRFHTRQFVNSSVCQFAECLLAYMGEQDPERFRKALRLIDPAALAERSFWWHEAAGLSAEAEPLYGLFCQQAHRESGKNNPSSEAL